MRVLDDEQHRLLAGQPDQLVDQHLQGPGAKLLRPEIERAVALLERQAEQGRHERCGTPHIDLRLRQQALELVELQLHRVARGKAGGTRQLDDRRIERAVGMVG